MIKNLLHYRYFLVVFTALLLSACTYNTDSKYATYASQAPNKSTSFVNAPTEYTITPDSFQKIAKLNSFETGLANTWELNGGKALQQTMLSPAVTKMYKSIKQGSGGEVNLTMDLTNFTFASHYASVTLNVKASQGQKLLFDKTYSAKSKSHTTSMWLKEGFAAGNVFIDATNEAMLDVINQMTADLQASVK